ncbi:DNA helicase Rep [Kangiella sediminilitoris]|uniref:ATP-dependent DNA helicase Rep n=1 Tax=Kangiella sediminilitoris TaxID=1144748 RepID=A0A1B3B7H8_9GAMM|nr:DNA helicase Rep [Kangiella sediminilitoris]AOE48747.1 ATP-dependent DNA helicase Rep [Kangiella sediminilitoris]
MSLPQLNERQQQALVSTSGPLLVLAGAGSGKTSVITRKIVYLIKQKQIPARNIVAVTFTNKAAREMKQRVGKIAGQSATKGLTVSTFHNFGLNFIRREYRTLGMKSNFTIFDDQDSLALLKDLGFKEAESDKALLLKLQNQISQWKNDLILPEQAIAQATDQELLIFAKVYEKYTRSMKAYNAVDFDDLILIPTLLLRDDPAVRDKWQNKIKYLLVDEYQDTNTSQYELIKHLVGQFGSFTVVGDDDQSIYSWRGARPENLDQLAKDYPKLQVIKLEQNYRSYGRILKAANVLIDNNPHVFEKKLWSDKPYGDPLRVVTCANEDEEAQKVVTEIVSRKVRTKNGKYSDYAILYRGNHQAKLFEKSLIANKVPYKISGSTSFFGRAEIKDIMAYLRLLTNEDDDNAFLRIANTPRRSIGPTTLEQLGTYAQKRHISLYAACFELGLEQYLSGKGLDSVRRFADTISRAADNAKRGDTLGVIHELIAKIGYHSWLHETSSTPKAAEFRWNNIQELLGWVEKSVDENQHDDNPFAAAVANLMLRDMLDRNEEEEEDSNQVQLMTLHAAKGLEFNHVYLVGMEEEFLPHKSSIENDDIEEERRLAYVGITRAQHTLVFTLCKKRNKFGEVIRCEPSRFLEEIPDEDLDWDEKRQPLSETEQEELADDNLSMLKALFSD